MNSLRIQNLKYELEGLALSLNLKKVTIEVWKSNTDNTINIINTKTSRSFVHSEFLVVSWMARCYLYGLGDGQSQA
jgi:hypothetical protein